MNSPKGAVLEQEKPQRDSVSSGPPPSGTLNQVDDWEYVTGFKFLMVMIVIVLACFTMLLDTSIIVTAIPRITSDFHSLGDVGWYGSAYLLANCSLQPMTGKFYTHFSTKWTFLFFLGLFEVGSLLCGVSRSSNMLIVGRAVSGMGGSGLQNGALTILSNCIPLEKRAAYLGFIIAFAQLGILFGPLIGGALTEYTTWRWCFYINIPIGAVVAAVLVFVHIPDRRQKTTSESTIYSTLKVLDLIGFALFAPTMIMFLLALEWGGAKYPWGSPMIIGLFCGATGSLLLFLAWEYKRGDTAMIPLGMIKQKIVASACITTFFSMGSMMVTTFYLAIYFQAVKGKTPTLGGVYILPGIVSQMVVAVVSGILVGRLGYYLPWSVGSGILTSIGSGLLTTYTPNTKVVAWVFFQIIGGVGRGCGFQMPIVAIQNQLPASQNSIGMALVIFSQTFGGSIFLAIAQTILNNGLAETLPKFAPNVTPKEVADAGATRFRAILPKESVNGVIQSYSVAVDHVFYFATAAAILSFFSCWGLGWKSVKKVKVVEPKA